MSVFAVIFTEADQASRDAAGARLKREFPGNFELVDDVVYFVKHDGLSSEIAKRVGIKGDGRVATGAVFKLNHAYSGYTRKTLWEWLGDDL